MKGAADILTNYAQKGAAMGVDCGRMCESCAFKKGSPTQKEPHNVQKALECLAYFGQFNCHSHGDHDFKDAGRPCAGFMYAKQYVESDVFNK